ncbi:MAG: phenylalanine--tRNA ligase subunit alpha [Candidatus Aenigmarchaeota archaeon]|nr:phenylalanine--tRNA ligase subunit alpha [Candidatus Aenigmarchaeota archaeon]
MNLQAHEAKLLKKLEDGVERTVTELSDELVMDQAAVVRASLTLNKEGLANTTETSGLIATITDEGKNAIKYGLPETHLINELKPGKKSIKNIRLKNVGIALGVTKSKGYIVIDSGFLEATKKGLKSLETKENELTLLENIKNDETLEKADLDILKSRKLAEYSFRVVRKIKATKKGIEFAKKTDTKQEVSKLTPTMIKSGKWRDVVLRKYNVDAPVAKVYPGKRHFVAQAIESVRKIWLEMGFKEMTGPMIQTSFWNFDALFVPQDHPAREMQDTFFLDLTAKKINNGFVNSIKKAHEKGTDNSLGWQYKWSKEMARKSVLRTHTTVLSARTLSQIKKGELPAKYFAIGRCFRNESLDWKHLFEFNQVEGIVVDENANFRHLLGYLKEFFGKLGFERARFRPAYFPYTEMSLEIEVYDNRRKGWIELGGAGIFRPEVVVPLLGKDVPVLAWGPGFDRIIMDYYKIRDIRDLYKNDVKQLRDMKQWMLG